MTSAKVNKNPKLATAKKQFLLRRAASAELWFPEGTIKRRGQRRRRLQPPTGSGYEERAANAALSVPSDVLFSNSMLEDMEKIWALRDVIPDPNVIPLESDNNVTSQK